MKKNIKFERFALPFLKKLAKTLLLEDHYPITIEPGVQKTSSYMECNLSYPYKFIEIHYSQSVIDDFEKDERKTLKNSLVHEMVHAITEPLYVKAVYRYTTSDEINDERERLTDHITNIVLRNELI